MRIILAFLCPPLAVLLCGKPLRALINVPLTVLFWFPGVLHALAIVYARLSEWETESTVRRMEDAIAARHPGLQPDFDRRRRRTLLRQTAAGLLLLIAAYLLGSGPAARLIESKRLPRPLPAMLTIAYSPLDVLARHSKAVGATLRWYRNLWSR